MSEKVRVHNPGRFEVVIDQAGHSLGAHTATYVERDAYTDALIASGTLLVTPEMVFPDVAAPAVEDSGPVLEVSEPAPEAPKPAPVTARKIKRTTNTVTAIGNGSEIGE